MSTLEIVFDSYHVETMWRWSDAHAPHYTARVVKTGINHKGTISTAHLTPNHDAVSVPVPVLVVLKMARGVEEISLLEHEARIYERELRHLQGSVVPVCYGLYHGQVGGGGGRLREKMACMVLEYCCSPQENMHPVDFGQSVMAATLAIHQAGVIHNGLLDGRNIVPCGGRGGGVRILDFAAASRGHVCYGGAGCEEMGLVGRRYEDCMPRIPGYHGRW